MKRLPGGPLLSGVGTVLLLAGSMTLPACTTDSYVGDSYYTGDTRYRVGGRYYHCHRGGTCHNVRHSNYYWSGGSYRRRPPHQQVRPLPPRPRPL
ncbi:hypothetical protein [Microbulbifer sediminum]|uniref:hypothetical protein n=1 Tax=Microbulbifer sediminum TaxID=2904250 RepID=UPI001F2257FB|nr:hypothetical protein [Microbulbifer sediminum]